MAINAPVRPEVEAVPDCAAVFRKLVHLVGPSYSAVPCCALFCCVGDSGLPHPAWQESAA